jgi:hypothetical protein
MRLYLKTKKSRSYSCSPTPLVKSPGNDLSQTTTGDDLTPTTPSKQTGREIPAEDGDNPLSGDPLSPPTSNACKKSSVLVKAVEANPHPAVHCVLSEGSVPPQPRSKSSRTAGLTKRSNSVCSGIISRHR